MSYSDSFPSSSPVFQANFSANGGRIDPRMTFTRSDTPPTYAAPSAVHYWSNEKHLSDENYATYSEQFDQWTQVGMSYTANATAAPDGNTTADLLYATASSNYAWLGNILASGTTRQKCCSFYVKANSWTWIQIGPNGGGRVWFDIATGTKGTENSGYTGTISAVGSTGWYRVSVESNDTTSLAPIIKLVDADGSSTATPSGTNGVYVWGCKAELGVTTPTAYVTATGSQLLREYAPTLKSVATAGQPRFEYDPSSDGQSAGTSLGILVEGQSTNLAEYSDDVSNWAGSTGIISGAQANACVGPTGSMAYAIVEPNIANTHYASINISGQDYSAAYTGSVYIKKLASGSGTKQVKLRINGMGGQAYAAFDLDSGAVVQQAGTAFNAATISSVSNGWYRISMTYTNQAADRSVGMLLVLSNGDSASLPNYTGDGYTAYGVANFQVEKSSFPSSPISTSGASATRASESLSVATADIGYTGGPVTVVGEVTGGQGYYPTIMRMSGPQDRLVLYKDSATATSATNNIAYVQVGSTLTATGTIAGSDGSTKVAITSDTDRVAYTADGGAVTVDTSSPVVSIDNMTIGVGSSSGTELNANLKRLVIYGESMSDTNLQAITS